MSAEALITLIVALFSAAAALARLAYQVGRAAKGIEQLKASLAMLQHDHATIVRPAIRSHRRLILQHEARLNELQPGRRPSDPVPAA